MSAEMQILIDALAAERKEWLDITMQTIGDPQRALIAMCCGAVLGGLEVRLTTALAALEARQPPVWQNMSDLSGAVSSSKTESFPQ